jgi:hypothetical protein
MSKELTAALGALDAMRKRIEGAIEAESSPDRLRGVIESWLQEWGESLEWHNEQGKEEDSYGRGYHDGMASVYRTIIGEARGALSDGGRRCITEGCDGWCLPLVDECARCLEVPEYE